MPINIGENHIAEEGIVRIPLAEAARLGRHRLRTGNIVYGRRGDIGRRALITDNEDGWLCGTGCLRIDFGSGVLDPEFATYFLSNPETRDWIVRRAVGTTMPNLNTAILAAVPFVVPPLSEQRAIGRALAALDDKIELNRRMNQTLESMARGIFRSWFVDFDPVVAKAAGRQPFGMSADVAALFPARFVDSDLGPIPINWHYSPLTRLAQVIMGASPPGSSYNFCGDGVSLINGPVEFGDRYPVRTKWTTAPTRRAQNGDLILCVRGSTTGRMVKSNGEYCLGRGVCTIRARLGCQSFIDVAMLLNLDRLLSLTAGSVFPNLTGADIEAFAVLTPPEALVLTYSSGADQLSAQIQANDEQSRTLAALRDTLLPKLMSGELRVRDAEKLAGSHV
jgi:type I restriction enzyme S subunit